MNKNPPQITSDAGDGARICGGAGLRAVVLSGNAEALIVLHSSSALSVLVASMHPLSSSQVLTPLRG